MVGLDLTHQALATPEVTKKIADVGTKPATFVLELLDFFRDAYRENQASSTRPCTTRAPSRTSSTRT